jgi:hypothetical protein
MYCLVNIPEYILRETYVKYRPLNEVGDNTGNCLFWESTKNILRREGHNLLAVREYSRRPEYYRDKISKVVFVCANLINKHHGERVDTEWIQRMKRFTRDHLAILEGLNCKKYLISIGAQSDNLKLFAFTQDQKKTLEAFFSHFEVSYLRGQYTRDLLAHNGIASPGIVAVGCPSLLLRPIDTKSLRSKLDRLRGMRTDEIRLGIAAGSMVARRDISGSLVDLMADRNTYSLVQSGPQWLRFVTGESFFPSIDHFRKSGSGLICSLRNLVLMLRIARNRGNFVYSDNCLESIDFFKDKVDCMVTTRIHGAVLGTLAGVPTLCMVTDSRTYELCEQMGIPYVNCITNPKYFKDKKDLMRMFLNHCRYSDKIDRTVEDMKKRYAVISKA